MKSPWSGLILFVAWACAPVGAHANPPFQLADVEYIDGFTGSKEAKALLALQLWKNRDAGIPITSHLAIDALIGEAACRRDDDCRVIGVGANACGGPDAYRAWSVNHTDGPLLEALVARDAAARRQAMERLGIASTCAILPVPGVACVAPASQAAMGRCALLPSAAGLK